MPTQTPANNRHAMPSNNPIAATPPRPLNPHTTAKTAKAIGNTYSGTPKSVITLPNSSVFNSGKTAKARMDNNNPNAPAVLPGAAFFCFLADRKDCATWLMN